MISPRTTDDGTSTMNCDGTSSAYSAFHFYASRAPTAATSNTPLMNLRSSGWMALPSISSGRIGLLASVASRCHLPLSRPHDPYDSCMYALNSSSNRRFMKVGMKLPTDSCPEETPSILCLSPRALAHI